MMLRLVFPLLVFCGFVVSQNIISSEEHHKSIPLDKFGHMPDHEDMETKSKMICSGCKWIVAETHAETNSLNILFNRKEGPPKDLMHKSYHEMCDKTRTKYGLKVNATAHRVLPEYTNRQPHVVGGWAEGFYMLECRTMISQLEKLHWDDVKGIMFQNGRVVKGKSLKALCPMCPADDVVDTVGFHRTKDLSDVVPELAKPNHFDAPQRPPGSPEGEMAPASYAKHSQNENVHFGIPPKGMEPQFAARPGGQAP
eukprot:PhF_6_TR37718/c0_g1_i1/m.56152